MPALKKNGENPSTKDENNSLCTFVHGFDHIVIGGEGHGDDLSVTRADRPDGHAQSDQGHGVDKVPPHAVLEQEGVEVAVVGQLLTQ